MLKTVNEQVTREMFSSDVLAKVLILIGVVLLGLGMILLFFKEIPFLGKLPGDLFIRKKNFTFFFPVTTSILLSIVLSLVLYFINKK